MSLLRVVIVTYENADQPLRALRSLEKHVFVPTEVIVWDNSARPLLELERFTSSHFSYYFLRSEKGNLGFGRAVNRALAFDSGKSATGYFILNPDAELLTPIDGALLRELQDNPALYGFGVYDDIHRKSRQPSARRFPRLAQAFFSRESILSRLFKSNSETRRYLGQDLDPDRVANVDWVSGCAMFATKATWERLGGFDERYFLYVEDVDLGRTASRLGIPVMYFPRVAVAHETRGSASRRPAAADYHHHVGMWRYHLKWSGIMGKLLAPIVGLGIAFRYLVRRIRT